MKNTFGNALTLTLFGESHGTAVGAVIDGIAPGIVIDENRITHALLRRSGDPRLSTERRESDCFSIISGTKDGVTCGTPLTILIENRDVRREDYIERSDLPRPGHADYASLLKYHGFADLDGGGHFSGRLTAPLVAVGEILRGALSQKGIVIGSHISSVHGIKDDPLPCNKEVLLSLSDSVFPTVSRQAENRMRTEILKAREAGDSVGGIVETVVLGIPAGVGEPWFDTVEGCLSHALFSVPAVKGVAFGDGFSLAEMKGSQANDPLQKSGKIVTAATEHAGGVFGGITVGAPVRFSVVVKPTPSISRPQQTLRLSTDAEETLQINGRHDPAVVCRTPAVIESVTAFVLADLLTMRYGTDWLGPQKDKKL